MNSDTIPRSRRQANSSSPGQPAARAASELRDQLRDAGAAWVELVAAAIEAGDAVPDTVDAHACAERLTALVDGLSARWLAELLTRERARELLTQAIAANAAPSRTG
jgi:hypothetical protein